ncbi:MAG: antibiotic biosynthesis monooxygenase [Flavipsychrobacter sp.]|nr:antibiotic biosynthesis monooxygenase [Flavipsychrobacter sp.]
MILRIVQMTFRSECIDDFKLLFDERKSMIRNFEGCRHLELWQDATNPNIFFTYSNWESEVALNHYRFSDLFKDTWSKTKVLFAEKASAWSVNRIIEVQ